MDGVNLQTKIYGAYGKAATKVGRDYSIFRPLVANAPLGNFLQTTKAAFSATPNYSFATPNEYGDPVWSALIDASLVQTGDYITGYGESYFIAGKQFLIPVLAVECNRSLRVVRQVAETSFGAVSYGAMVPSKEVEVLGTTGNLWPASFTIGGKAQRGLSLPADVKQSGWRILLPPSVPINLLYGDIAISDLGRRFVFEQLELSDLGWRIMATELHT